MSTAVVTPPTPEPEVIEFTPAQQAKLDEILKKAMGRAGAEARQRAADLEQKVTKLEADLTEAKKAVESAKTPTERKEAIEEVVELRAQMEEMKNARTHTTSEIDGLRKQLAASNAEGEKARAEALDQKKLMKMTTAASKEDFVDLTMVLALTHKNVQWNEQESKWTVLSDEGQPRMTPSYDPMTVEQFYEDFALKHPYLVKGKVISGGGGSGSSGPVVRAGSVTKEQVFGKNSNAKLANDLALKNPSEYKRLKAEAKEAGLIG